jgi:hypothetical protein
MAAPRPVEHDRRRGARRYPELRRIGAAGKRLGTFLGFELVVARGLADPGIPAPKNSISRDWAVSRGRRTPPSKHQCVSGPAPERSTTGFKAHHAKGQRMTCERLAHRDDRARIHCWRDEEENEDDR